MSDHLREPKRDVSYPIGFTLDPARVNLLTSGMGPSCRERVWTQAQKNAAQQALRRIVERERAP